MDKRSFFNVIHFKAHSTGPKTYLAMVDCLAMAGLVLVFESLWQLTTCHKAFVVSGTHVHFGHCDG